MLQRLRLAHRLGAPADDDGQFALEDDLALALGRDDVRLGFEQLLGAFMKYSGSAGSARPSLAASAM